MLEVTPIFPVKYKRRKVSAIREFPKGCGRRAFVPNSKPLGEPSVPVEAECIATSKPDDAPLPFIALELPPVVEASFDQVITTSKPDEPPVPADSKLDDAPVPAIALELPPVVVEASLDQVSSKEGPSILKLDEAEIWKGLEPLESVGSLENHEAEEEGKKVALGDEGSPRDFAEEVVRLENSEVLKVNLGEPVPSVELRTDAVAVENQVRSRVYPPPKRRKVSAIRYFPPGCGRNAPPLEGHEGSKAVACSDSKKLNGEDMIAAGGKADAEVSDRLLPIENGENQVIVYSNKRHELSQEITGESEFEMSRSEPMQTNIQETKAEVAVYAAPKINILYKGKLVAGEEVIAGGAVSDTSAEMVEDEKGMQKISKVMICNGAREISGDSQLNHDLGNVVNETIEDGQYEEKVLGQAGSRKELVVHDLKQVKKNLQIREAGEKSSHLEANSLSGSKSVDNEARNLLVTEAGVGTSKIQKESESFKRKLSEEIENKGHVKKVRIQRLEAYAERLVTQALMAAENCPWTHVTKSNAFGSRSLTLKPKAKKGGKSLGRKFASMEVLASQIEDKMVVKEEDDFLRGEQDAKKAVVLHQRPHELELTLFPVVPDGVNYEKGDSPEVTARKSVKRILRIFRFVCWKLLQVEETKSKDLGRNGRVDLKAANILKENKGWVNPGKQILGIVPGVEIGDEFQYRVELSIVGLHRPFQGGIDSTKINGKLVATSIVASGGYPDDIDGSDVLIYSGAGGNPMKDKEAGDQKLERGNLALKNSITAKTPVRVIYGFKRTESSHDGRPKVMSTFTYDGLYLVEDFWPEKGPHGFLVFKFRLRRVPGQPELALKEVKKSQTSKRREGLCVKDISEGRERLPICAVNTVDGERPPPFVYITKMMYPSWYTMTPPKGCNCIGRCSDSKDCACAVKNGGEIPYNFDGAIVIAKPLVYECGPSCKCPPSCYNRVSQHGIKIHLEIFKTKSRGWGVRSLSSIPSGSFICEYIGELLHDREAEQQVGNDEYLFDIGRNYDDDSLWEGLPSFIPSTDSSQCERVNDVGLTIDAAKYANVGRFLNHSCSPNLYAQNVLYDHDDKNVPHVMFFAADNIPPMQELTYHYNYQIGEVRDSDGNIREKNCYCGALDCCGRLY